MGRLARIWTANHIEYFYKVKGEARAMEFPQMAEMQRVHNELNAKLNCRDMDWYLRHVDHEMAWEMDKICIPGLEKSHPWACKLDAIPGRSTIDRTMPREEFLKARSVAEQ